MGIHEDYIRPEDGCIEGYIVETHYLPARTLILGDGYLRIVGDNDPFDFETRVSYEDIKSIAELVVEDAKFLTAEIRHACDTLDPEMSHVEINELRKRLLACLPENRQD